jgi:ABC-type transporter Mla MlaB component
VPMTTRTTGRPAASHTGIFSSTEARPGATREEELVELEDTLRAAITSTLAEAAGPVTIASAQRADRYAALALAGALDAAAMRAVGAHLRGQLDAGSRHLVVDLSRVGRVDERLTALLRRVEARMASRGDVLELTGLTPRVLHGMDDDPLARVFALHRAALERALLPELTWAALRCPEGLDEVAEPHTAARHRAVIDTGAGRPGRARRPLVPPG